MVKLTSILLFLTFSIVEIPLFGAQGNTGVQNAKKGPSDLYVPDAEKYGVHNTITIKNARPINQQSGSGDIKPRSSSTK